MTYPRKVLISRDHEVGFAGPNGWDSKTLAEDPELVAMVEAGEHKTKRQAFTDRAAKVTDENAWSFDYSATNGLRVVTVAGPYIIREYDGNEFVLERDKVEWW